MSVWSIKGKGQGELQPKLCAKLLIKTSNQRAPSHLPHYSSDSWLFQTPGFGLLLLSSSCKKASEYINRCLVIWNKCGPSLPPSIHPHPPRPALTQLCLLASQVWNDCLQIPFNNKWNCLLPIGCQYAYKSWCAGGRGSGRHWQLWIHYCKEIAVLLNGSSLKKHPDFAFFFCGSKDTIVDQSPGPQRSS